MLHCLMLAKHCSRPMVTPIVLPRPCLPPLHPQKATASTTRNPLPQLHALPLDLGALRRPHLTLMISSRPTHTNTAPELQGTRKVTRCLDIRQKTHHRCGQAQPDVAKGNCIVDFFIGALPASGLLVLTRFATRLASLSCSAALAPVSCATVQRPTQREVVNLLGSLTVPTIVDTRLMPTAPLSSNKSADVSFTSSDFGVG